MLTVKTFIILLYQGLRDKFNASSQVLYFRNSLTAFLPFPVSHMHADIQLPHWIKFLFLTCIIVLIHEKKITFLRSKLVQSQLLFYNEEDKLNNLSKFLTHISLQNMISLVKF